MTTRNITVEIDPASGVVHVREARPEEEAAFPHYPLGSGKYVFKLIERGKTPAALPDPSTDRVPVEGALNELEGELIFVTLDDPGALGSRARAIANAHAARALAADLYRQLADPTVIVQAALACTIQAADLLAVVTRSREAVTTSNRAPVRLESSGPAIGVDVVLDPDANFVLCLRGSNEGSSGGLSIRFLSY